MPATLSKPAKKPTTPIGATWGMTTAGKIAAANRWREQYNPLRGLTMAKAVTLAESYPRGEMADLQWTYHFLEQTDPDLMALVERRTSAICSLDWVIKQTPEHRRTSSWDQSLADEQLAALREAYDRIDNLYEWLEHAAMASFRGFAHAEKHRSTAGDIVHLEILDQWNAVRCGLRGQWKYNPTAQNLAFERLPEDTILDPAHWIIRDTKRHINRIGLFKFVRQNLSQKDWDGFIEIYGLPGIIIIGPPTVPAGKEPEYETAAKAAADGGSGLLPHGSTVHTSDSPRGVNPFRDHLRFLQEQLVLVGTGGLLTMLSQSGSGTLAGGAHQDTFDIIARAEGRKISEVAQAQIDTEILSRHFPGMQRLAYWELAGEQQVDPKEIADLAWKLKLAGLRPAPDQIGEKVGLELAEIPLDQLAGVSTPPAIPNRRTATPRPVSIELLRAAKANVAKATADDLQPIRRRLERILQIEDAEVLRNRLIEFRAELPALLRDINADPSAARALEETLAAALLNGMAARAAHGQISNNCGTGDGGFQEGNKCAGGGSGGGNEAHTEAQAKIKDVLSGKSEEAVLGPVSAEMVQRIKKDTGINVAGYSHFIDRDALIHIDRGHGVGKERRPDQEPITAAEIELIPQIVSAPDTVRYSGRSQRGYKTIEYTKRFNGTIFYVEEEWRDNKLLATKTMWKKKGTTNV